MEDAYLNNTTFKDLILKYLIEEIIKEEKGDSSNGWVLIPD